MGFATGPVELGPVLYPEEHHEGIKPLRNICLGAVAIAAIIGVGPEIIEATKSGLDAVGAFITELAGKQE